MQVPYNLKIRSYNYITVSSNLDLLSYKYFPYPPSSSKSSTRPRSTTQSNKSTEHSAIQKAVSTALWLQFTLIVCYLPRVVSIYLLTEPNIVAISYTITLVFFNSSLNPILYCWKIDEVRQAMEDTIRQILCC